MVKVTDLFNFLQTLANKDQLGSITPAQFNIALHPAQLDFMNSLLAPEEDIARGVVPLSPAVADSVEILLQPFLVVDAGAVTQAVAYADLSEKPRKVLAVFVDGNEARRVTKQRLGEELSSSIAPPTSEFPIYELTATGIKTYPAPTTGTDIHYYKEPPKGNLAYNLVSGRPVIDEGTSTHLEWEEVAFNDIAYRVASYIGINLRDPLLAQYSEGKKQTAK